MSQLSMQVPLDVQYKGTQGDQLISGPLPSRRAGERHGAAPGTLAKGPETPGADKTASLSGAFQRALDKYAGLVGTLKPRLRMRPTALKVGPGIPAAAAAAAQPASFTPAKPPRQLKGKFDSSPYLRVRDPGMSEQLFVHKQTGAAGVFRPDRATGGAVVMAPTDPLQKDYLNRLKGGLSHTTQYNANVARGAVNASPLRALGARVGDWMAHPIGQALVPQVAGAAVDAVTPRDRYGRKFSQTGLGSTVLGVGALAAPALARRAVGPAIG